MTTAIKLTKKQEKLNRQQEAKAKLVQLLADNNHTVYTNTLHTSQSGMLRSIVTTLEDGTNITDLVAEVCEYSHHKTGGLRVVGGGMDMGFHVVYYLSVKLYCDNG